MEKHIRWYERKQYEREKSSQSCNWGELTINMWEQQ